MHTTTATADSVIHLDTEKMFNDFLTQFNAILYLSEPHLAMRSCSHFGGFAVTLSFFHILNQQTTIDNSIDFTSDKRSFNTEVVLYIYN